MYDLQGPPGTGKTRTLLAYMEVMVKTPPRQPLTPILACADTNAAVDNIVEGLVERGIRVVRLGQPAKVSLPARCYALPVHPSSCTVTSTSPCWGLQSSIKSSSQSGHTNVFQSTWGQVVPVDVGTKVLQAKWAQTLSSQSGQKHSPVK